MEPYTASSLKITKKNSLRDFVSVAGPLSVTHLIIATETENDGYLKIIRLPRGPTMYFKIEEFSLNKDVVSALKKPCINSKQFLHQPLLVLNGFNLNKATDEPKNDENTTDNNNNNKANMHHKLIATMLQNMFPPINVTKVHLNEIKRCAMFNYNREDDTIDFRH